MRSTTTIVVLVCLLILTVGAIVWITRPDVFGGSGEREPAADVGPDHIEAPDGVGGRDTIEPEEPFTGPRLYLVLDDGGHTTEQLRDFEPFRGVYTVAVLPGLDYSGEVARRSLAAGHEVILHQPMEALGGNALGPGAIYADDSEDRIARVLADNIDSLPGITGVNNHMGSKATTDERVMHAVAETLGDYELFFLDSRTTHESVAFDVAARAGLETAARDVFLDNERDEAAISDQLDRALAIAAERGYAVMIGHVTSPELARVLVRRYGEIVDTGFRFFPLSDLMERVGSARADTRN